LVVFVLDLRRDPLPIAVDDVVDLDTVVGREGIEAAVVKLRVARHLDGDPEKHHGLLLSHDRHCSHERIPD
jgi:hypothetical protein